MRRVIQIIVVLWLSLPSMSRGEIQATYTPSIKAPFALKGEWLGGITLSTGAISSDNSTLLLFLDDITADGTLFSIQPFAGYFYSDNRCVGVRVGYTRFDGDVSDIALDLGESNDMDIDIPSLTTASTSYSAAIFHRSYASMDRAGRFALFADLEASYAYAFSHSSIGDDRSKNRSHNVAVAFNPGVAIYLFPNVCTTFSFGLGGLNYTNIEQLSPTTGEVIGSSESSQLSFKFNIAAINFGIVFHFWGGE